MDSQLTTDFLGGQLQPVQGLAEGLPPVSIELPDATLNRPSRVRDDVVGGSRLPVGLSTIHVCSSVASVASDSSIGF